MNNKCTISKTYMHYLKPPNSQKCTLPCTKKNDRTEKVNQRIKKHPLEPVIEHKASTLRAKIEHHHAQGTFEVHY